MSASGPHRLVLVTAVWATLGTTWLAVVGALTPGFVFAIVLSGFAVAFELTTPSHHRPVWVVRARRALVAQLLLFGLYVPLRLYDLYVGF
ncbi:hypothetical protein AUR64_07535 [Haloprofundus marisrubri]|uniref:Uncharacterized protein n=1 Tax=Haloprofundus marisrubri TaxID=1514971 RepID=A0A0W1RC09_9EURY|nr:hypothetical protein [Haloprofundus marisrubri]KTG11010.1 hypothetical protein AUR64_07535 [Haloprofundus marisrubri]